MSRVVSLLPSSTEIICALGCRERLAGRSHECDFPAGVGGLPACTAPKFDPDGTSYQIDQRVKAILQEAVSVYRVDAGLLDRLEPDWLVTQSQCEVCAVSLEEVEKAACQLVRSRPAILSLEPNLLADVWRDIERVAAALEVEDRGRALLAGLRERLEGIAARTRRIGDRPRVACIEWFEPLMAAGNWIPELVEIAGGRNLFSSAGSHSPWLTWEALVQIPARLHPADALRLRHSPLPQGAAGPEPSPGLVQVARGAGGAGIPHGRQPVLQPPRAASGGVGGDSRRDPSSPGFREHP